MFSYTTRSAFGASKRLRVPVPFRSLSSPGQPNAPSSDPVTTSQAGPAPTLEKSLSDVEKPSEPRVQEWRSIRDPYGGRRSTASPVCDLQLRSYSVQNVEFFADFAIRAAYYLNLPVSGPVPLPRIVERWTVPRSNFVHKKSQENFERITLRRLVQIKDGNPQAVQAWLAFLRRHAFYGVGMKANVWEHDSLDVGKSMDASLPEIEKTLRPHLQQFGQREDNSANQSIFDALDSDRFVERKNL
ncbi:37S ribosomal protein S10 [Penicillium atrosanguineum]|uniref:Small ribosomal subunit protein uS10m n=1 Tax=Penicillium atrosanguineum TaxID=1132637 RepID=A0A9W9UD09_9EURO|nr:37S ribosomal protein S10 [Penicillium atrosanguineum]